MAALSIYDIAFFVSYMTAAVRRHYEDSEYTDKKIQKHIGKCLAESGDSEGKRCERQLRRSRKQFDREHENDDVEDNGLENSERGQLDEFDQDE